MEDKRVYRIIAQRLVVQILEINRPDVDEENLSEDEVNAINNEYNAILARLTRVAVKNGGNFNQFRG